ncbi:MAG: sulfotransferase [Proteobacteria bacterium]|nr:sulfotransferase [Pseudomonadota bacterium]
MTGNSTPSWAGFLPALARKSLHVVNRAASYLDTIAAAHHATSPSPIVVVGLPRSGTTLAYELIVQAFDVAYLTRAYSYTYGIPNLTTRIITRFTRRRRARYVSDYGRIPGIFAPTENAVLWMQWFAEHSALGHYFPNSFMTAAVAADTTATIASMSSIAKRPFVFKNIYLTLALPALLETLTKSRVIVITRDIDAITASVFKKRRTLSATTWWSIRPPFVEHVAHDGIVEQTAFQCIRSQQVLERSLSLVDEDRCLIVDYSDICRSPVDFIANVARWAGNDLQLRAGADIPRHFDLSPSVGYPAHTADHFSQQSDALNSDRHQYLSRIDDYVAECAAND